MLLVQVGIPFKALNNKKSITLGTYLIKNAFRSFYAMIDVKRQQKNKLGKKEVDFQDVYDMIKHFLSLLLKLLY